MPINGALFLPQANLDKWLEEGHVDMGHEDLIFTADNTKYPLTQAVRFKNQIDGTDEKKLLGKVKATDALRMAGAEVSLGAVIIGSAGYEVEDGYMITVPLPEKPKDAARAKPTGEADLLAQFILNKLT